MKKIFTAAVASMLIFGGQVAVEAASVNLSEPTVQTQEMSTWTKFRDNLLGRDRHERARHNYNDHRRYRSSPNGHGAPPPPPRR